jgi:hypothetical protein
VAILKTVTQETPDNITVVVPNGISTGYFTEYRREGYCHTIQP